MHTSLKAAVLAFALAGGVVGGTAVVHAADVSVQFNSNDVAFGYSDGYWDKSHTWHEWQKPEHRETYKKAEGNQYHEWKHDRDPDKGWHDTDKR